MDIGLRLLDNGRGQYSTALTWMARRVENGPTTVCTDHDFRNRKIFDYYSARLWPLDPPLKYVELANRPAEGTDWMILQNVEEEPPYPDHVADPFGNSYQLESVYHHQV